MRQEASLASIQEHAAQGLATPPASSCSSPSCMGKARSGRGGSEVGVDVERLKVDMEDQSIREIINTNVALGSEIGARAHRFFSIWASQPGLDRRRPPDLG
jgi:hypothetical protein